MSKIIERIQKLLKLAAHAGSEAEAALAAERAAQMMAEHEIHEAEVALHTPGETRAPEPIEKCFEVTKTAKKVAWHMRVAYGVAKSYGAAAYWHGGRVVLFGRLSAVQAANYTTQYLMAEVERITDREAPTSQYSRAYRNAFRLGCANRIEVRLNALTAAKLANPTGFKYDNEPGTVTNIPSEDAAEIQTHAAVTQALAIVEKDRKEVEDAYTSFSAKWSKRRANVGKVTSGSGYKAGREAGDRVNLGGNAKGGLPKGTGVLG